jgi:hypothetical protein
VEGEGMPYVVIGRFMAPQRGHQWRESDRTGAGALGNGTGAALVVCRS